MRDLPLDVILYNILPRLSGRSLIRFLSVSKQWHSFLQSPVFANMHVYHLRNDDLQNHYKLLVISRQGPTEFSTIDCETLEISASRPLPFKVSFGKIWIISSCNGLLLVLKKEFTNDNVLFDLILWNPLTSDHKILAKSDSNKNLYDVLTTVFELYYNSSDKDYKLVRVTYDYDVYIYSLKSDSWRKVNSNDAYQCMPNLISLRVMQSTCLNENLYFLESYRCKNIITKFDTKTEKFSKIATPFRGNREWSSLMVQRGCIHLCVRNCSSKKLLDIWMMKSDGDWMKVSTYNDEWYNHRFLKPLHLMRDGNWLMKCRTIGYLYKVDTLKKHKDVACIYTLSGIEEERYIQTFVSPNQSMN